MTLIHSLLSFALFGVWFFTAYNWFQMVRMRQPHVTLSTLIFNGMKSFDPDNFKPEAQLYCRRFNVGFITFFVLVGLVAAVTVAGI